MRHFVCTDSDWNRIVIINDKEAGICLFCISIAANHQPAYSRRVPHTSVSNLPYEVAQMKASMKEILRRGAAILTMTAFCITGSYVFSHRKAEIAMETAAKTAAPVVCIDAGHGASR